MYSAQGLLEFCKRANGSLEKLIEHCRCFSDDEFNRRIDGFGYSTIKHQLHHAIAAQKYWIGVLEDRMDVDDDPDDSFTIDDMEEYHNAVQRIAESFLRSASTEELTTARPMTTWGDIEKILIPAHVVIRTLTHLYHHQGQIVAMCRLMNKPVEPGLDYPIIP
ncbi:MAG: hypothetical protein GF315_00835 [candidate division Zixibacteria bacterium]|nr:hypothetical protein [candidate division Zixibacteria bacterium]